MIAVLIGDVLTQPYDLVYTITFTARIANVTGIATGTTVINTASAVWDTSNTADPTTSDHLWNCTCETCYCRGHCPRAECADPLSVW